LPAWAEGAFRHFFQHVVAADGFNDLVLGLVAVLFIVILMLAAVRLSGMLVVGRGGLLLAGMFGARRVFGMRGVFLGVLGVDTLVMSVLFVDFGCSRGRGLDRCRDRHIGVSFRHRRFAGGMTVVGLVMGMFMLMLMGVFVIMGVRMVMTFMIMMLGIGMVMFGVVGVTVIAFGVRAVGVVRQGLLAVLRLSGRRGIGAGVLDDLALDPLATAAAALIAMARTAAPVTGAVFAFFLGFAMGAFVGLDQRLAIGDRNLIIIRVDFAEGEEAVAVAAIFDEGCLQ
jgi:hypothetical protein